MKKIQWIFALAFSLGLQIYASPASDTLELTAALCHFSDSGLRCSCPEEAMENRNDHEKTLKKVRKQNL